MGKRSTGNTSRIYPLGMVFVILFSACTFAPFTPQNPPPEIENLPPPTSTPYQAFLPGLLSVGASGVEASPAAPVVSTPLSSPIPQIPTLQPDPENAVTLWIAPYLPVALQEKISLPEGVIVPVAEAESAALRLEVSPQRPLSYWVYALVTPFPTIPDGVSFNTLQRAWRGEAVGPFAGRPLLLDESTRAALSALWGEPAASAVAVLPAVDLLDYAWNNRPAWAIIPFEDIEPRWKVLQIDSQSPLHKDFDPAAYPLDLPISLFGEPVLLDATLMVYGSTLVPATNRDPSLLTVLAMTGVTALVRSTAFAMERQGINYPAGDIAGWLRDADLTHVSNEVPFAQGCPFPDPFQQGMRFCSDPRYIELLKTIGTDIVELSGDHFQDWGVEAMNFTLDLYRQQGWLYYGGGANSEEGRQALLVEHNGNRLAFIGCNAKGGSYAQAGPKSPGAVACGYDYMESEITRLRAAGYLPIATFQHFEYYTYEAQPDQKRDFGRMARAGAVIVSGSQAHQPQALEFLNGGLIHFGLGNLFFDQYEVSLATRQAFVDRHVFYAGRYLGVELLSMMFIDYARPRPMTPAERQDLLQAVFAASGW
jgi:hypothetical protein